MKRILFYILLLIISAPLQAQDGEEYRMELGAGAGLMGYLGDFNGSLTKNLQLWELYWHAMPSTIYGIKVQYFVWKDERKVKRCKDLLS